MKKPSSLAVLIRCSHADPEDTSLPGRHRLILLWWCWEFPRPSIFRVTQSATSQLAPPHSLEAPSTPHPTPPPLSLPCLSSSFRCTAAQHVSLIGWLNAPSHHSAGMSFNLLFFHGFDVALALGIAAFLPQPARNENASPVLHFELFRKVGAKSQKSGNELFVMPERA